MEQCEIIFECRVCRNLFRGLANFIAHKRVYCKQRHYEAKLPFVETKQEPETVVQYVHPTKPPPEKQKEEWDDYIDSDEETAKKDVLKGRKTNILAYLEGLVGLSRP